MLPCTPRHREGEIGELMDQVRGLREQAEAAQGVKDALQAKEAENDKVCACVCVYVKMNMKTCVCGPSCCGWWGLRFTWSGGVPVRIIGQRPV
jgi:hypothetical protein